MPWTAVRSKAKVLLLLTFCLLLQWESVTGKRELVALLNLSSWCLVMVERLFLAVPWGCLRFVIVVFPDHTHLLFFGATCKLTSRWRSANGLVETKVSIK